ncbi:MAG TPA: class I SAM-dependent methyltransferase [Acidimicrobiales bacterium]|jgi:SAM-dependent methyltransferase|nr:class I SAM-dependent methyltransferase [Acidimicrobiales bacterium]
MASASTSLGRYDTIGVGYRNYRQPDPRVASRLAAALGDAERIVNVGAGAGSYEPQDRWVVAIEPSPVMLEQHPGRPKLRAAAEHVPFPNDAFDAALAIFTVHHWVDPAAGLAELRRVARRQVLLTFEAEMEAEFWLGDYVPAIRSQEHSWVATIDAVAGPLGTDHVEVLPVPHDCIDGFMAAYWRRPERYLDPGARASISGLALLSPHEIEPGMTRLEADLESGAWRERYGHLLELDELDCGYRIVVAGDGA